MRGESGLIRPSTAVQPSLQQAAGDGTSGLRGCRLVKRQLYWQATNNDMARPNVNPDPDLSQHTR